MSDADCTPGRREPRSVAASMNLEALLPAVTLNTASSPSDLASCSRFMTDTFH